MQLIQFDPLMVTHYEIDLTGSTLRRYISIYYDREMI